MTVKQALDALEQEIRKQAFFTTWLPDCGQSAVIPLERVLELIEAQRNAEGAVA